MGGEHHGYGGKPPGMGGMHHERDPAI
jgi:hypothetical protein